MRIEKIIKELSYSSNNKDLILYEAEFISLCDEEKQNEFISKLRQLRRKQNEFAEKTILKFNW